MAFTPFRVPGAAQREAVRCRTGTVINSDGPGSAMHRYALHRIRDTQTQPPKLRFTVSTMRGTVGSTMSSRLSAAGSGMCGVVMRTGGPSRS